MKPVELKENALMINGRPVILLSSSLFYFRIPQEYWEERMWQLKACGYNAIDVYIPWNFHELTPGKWDFSGMRDVDRFLALARENGLYVVARPGPYICSEWDGGALPAWLGLKLRQEQLRQYDSAYLKEVEKWFDKILPILERRQLGREGSVILLQLENELDIYQCREPKLYLEALVKMTEKFQIQIPRVVCTSSQLDMDYSGATAEKVYPAFNIYSAPEYPALEERLQIIWSKLKGTEWPLLTTETMRRHYFLRRELIGGIRLISPYCQTASANYDCYNGISTWGNSREKPVSYMTNDYDHGAMIRSDGRVTEEYLEARLMGNLIAALGEELAAGSPVFDRDMEIEENYTGRAFRKAVMELKSGGALLCIPNVGADGGEASITFEGMRLTTRVEGESTLILPFRVPLTIWEMDDAEIICSSMELLSVEKTGEASWLLILYGEGSGTRIRIGEKEWMIRPGQEQVLTAEDERQLLVKAVSRQEAARMKTAYLPAFEELLEGQKKTTKADWVKTESFHFPACAKACRIAPMENYGLYNGTVVYTFELPKGTEEILLDGAADIVQVSVDGRPCPALYGKGGMLCIPARGSRAVVRTESWGHNCGHGIGYPVIVLGSLKGIGRAFGTVERRDIQYNWQYHVVPEAEVDSLRLFLREWTVAADFGERLPLPLEEMQVYQKEIQMPENGSHRFLHMEGGEIPVRVYINGAIAGKLTAQNPWLDISEATEQGRRERITLACTVSEMNPLMGHIFLVSAQEIKDCRAALYPADNWKSEKPAASGEEEIPVHIPVGEIRKISFYLPDTLSRKKLWISFEGKGVKILILGGGLILGRIFVGCDMPDISVCSGSPDRVWLPDAFFDQGGEVTLLAEALEENAVIEKIVLESQDNPF